MGQKEMNKKGHTTAEYTYHPIKPNAKLKYIMQ